MVFTYTAAEPSQPKSIISLCSIDIRFRRGIEGLKKLPEFLKEIRPLPLNSS
jgi:hypothetical protein